MLKINADTICGLVLRLLLLALIRAAWPSVRAAIGLGLVPEGPPASVVLADEMPPCAPLDGNQQ